MMWGAIDRLGVPGRILANGWVRLTLEAELCVIARPDTDFLCKLPVRSTIVWFVPLATYTDYSNVYL